MRGLFSEEELAALWAADAEIEREDKPLTWEEVQAARKRDMQARRDAMADERKAAELERRRQKAYRYYHSHKAERAAYKVRWRQEHKAEIAEYNRKYYAANLETIKEAQRKYRAANKEAIAAYQRGYRAANKDRLREMRKEKKA